MPTATQVRDRIVECFVEAHREYLKANAGKGLPDEEVDEQTRQIVKTAFELLQADYDNPTKEDLVSVLEILAFKARSARRDEATIQANARRMMRLIEGIGQ